MNSRSFSRSIILLSTRLSNRFGDDTPSGMEILKSLLNDVYQMDAKRIDAILADGRSATDILTDIKDADKTRVTKLTADGGTEDERYKKGYSKAKGEVLTASEEAFKKAKGFTSDLKGEALYDAYIQTKLAEAGATGEDAIIKTTTYQQMETRLKKDVEDAKAEGEKKVKELQDTYRKEGTLSKVGKAAIELVTGMNAVFSTNATVADTQRADFIRELSENTFDDTDPANIIVMDAQGRVLKDDHGNTLKFADYIKAKAEKRFEFSQNNGGENADNKNKDPKQQSAEVKYPASVKKRPKNPTELQEAMKGLSTADKRIVMDAYKKDVGTVAK